MRRELKEIREREREKECGKVGHDTRAEADVEMKGEEMKQISIQIFLTWLTDEFSITECDFQGGSVLALRHLTSFKHPTWIDLRFSCQSISSYHGFV